MTLHQRVRRTHTSQPGLLRTGASVSVSLHSATAGHMHHTAVVSGMQHSHKSSLGRVGGGHSRHSPPQLLTVSPRLTPESGPRTRRRSLVSNCTRLGSQGLLHDKAMDRGIAQGFVSKQALRSSGCAIAAGPYLRVAGPPGTKPSGSLLFRFLGGSVASTPMQRAESMQP